MVNIGDWISYFHCFHTYNIVCFLLFYFIYYTVFCDVCAGPGRVEEDWQYFVPLAISFHCSIEKLNKNVNDKKKLSHAYPCPPFVVGLWFCGFYPSIKKYISLHWILGAYVCNPEQKTKMWKWGIILQVQRTCVDLLCWNIYKSVHVCKSLENSEQQG